MSCKIIKIKRGARLTFNPELRYPGFDWTGVGVKIQLRESPDADAVCTIDTSGGDSGTSISTSITQPGVYTIIVNVEGTVTDEWPDSLMGDIRVYRGSPLFGPYMVGDFGIEVVQPSTP